MAETRDSKKSPTEIYADEVVRLQLPYWQTLAQSLTAPATSTTTPAATVPNLQSYMPMILLGGGALILLMALRR